MDFRSRDLSIQRSSIMCSCCRRLMMIMLQLLVSLALLLVVFAPGDSAIERREQKKTTTHDAKVLESLHSNRGHEIFINRQCVVRVGQNWQMPCYGVIAVWGGRLAEKKNRVAISNADLEEKITSKKPLNMVRVRGGAGIHRVRS
jgi:hypothetical protein